MPIPVLTSRRSPRLQWVIDHICAPIMGLDLQVSTELPTGYDGPLIRYGGPSEEGIRIPDSGLLWETGVRRLDPQFRDRYLFPLVKEPTQGPMEFDLFGAIFWLVSEYDNWSDPILDHHGRYVEAASVSDLGLAQQPVVHLWLKALRNQLLHTWPTIASAITCRKFPHRITVDLDHPWKYLHKPLHVQVGGLLKAILEGRFAEVQERILAAVSRKDPHQTFDRFLDLVQPEQLTMLALIERLDQRDTRYTWRHHRWRSLLQSLHQQGVRIGIHPSYRSSDIPGQIQAETQRLTSILSVPIRSSRMHFMRYRLPQTRRQLLESGIEEDFTLYRNGEGGFPNGMMIPYPWYDLDNETVTALRISPTIMMDRTIVGVKKQTGRDLEQSIATARQNVERVLGTIQEGNGSFVLCLHNECLSESGEWAGWSSFFSDLIRILQQDRML